MPVLKVMHIGTAFDAQEVEPYRGLVAAILLDTHVTGKRGGTGKTFSWHNLREPPEWAPLFVAGGLDPDNVGDVIRVLRPYAVDVSSGVEIIPGAQGPAPRCVPSSPPFAPPISISSAARCHLSITSQDPEVFR